MTGARKTLIAAGVVLVCGGPLIALAVGLVCAGLAQPVRPIVMLLAGGV